MNFEDLRLFVTTLNEGSFTAAADKLGLSKQFVSRRTLLLEESLGGAVDQSHHAAAAADRAGSAAL